MASDLEIALARIDPDDFEELCADLLTREGYTVTPTSTSGRDGGRESILTAGERTGILHCSVQQNGWKGKLTADAKKAAEHNREYDFFYFGTTADPGGKKRDGLEAEVAEKHGWEVDVWDYSVIRNRLIGDTGNHDLAREHLGVNPGVTFNDSLGEAKELRKERLNQIEHRYDLPLPLTEGPVMALHLIPAGAFSMEYGYLPEDLPAPPFYGMPDGMGEPVGDGKVSTNRRFQEGRYPQYAYFDEEGWIEAVTTDIHPPFRDEPSGVIRNDVDNDLFVMLPRCLDCLEEIGAKPPIFAFVSLLGVEGYTIDSNQHGLRFSARPFADRYTPRHASIDSYDDPPKTSIRPVLDRIWQKAGRRNGSPFYPNR